MNRFLLKVKNQEVLIDIKKCSKIIWNSQFSEMYLIETDKSLNFIKSIDGVISVRKPLKGSFGC